MNANIREFLFAPDDVLICARDPNDETVHMKRIEASQTWFWTKKWQALEREADEDLAEGRYDDFDTMEDFILSLSGST